MPANRAALALRRAHVPCIQCQAPSHYGWSRRSASSSSGSTSSPSNEAAPQSRTTLSPTSTRAVSEETLEQQIASFDPVAHARARRTPLPAARYAYRSPRYYRGPLHPHQPPPKSHPSSREFVPGPFSLPRMMQTYDATCVHDLMVLLYKHIPPGTPKPATGSRLREWDDASPYYENRPPRLPRGVSGRLPLLRRPTTFRNVPRLTGIHINTRLGASSLESSSYTHAAGMVLQALTGKRATVFLARENQGQHRPGMIPTRRGKPTTIGVTIGGELMWHFFSTLITVVLPRIKEWRGLRGHSCDNAGQFFMHLPSEIVGQWPEISLNYDSYPSKHIPDLRIFLQTSATRPRDARMLLASLGLPFREGSPE